MTTCHSFFFIYIELYSVVFIVLSCVCRAVPWSFVGNYMTECNPIREGRIWELVQEVCSLSLVLGYTISTFIHVMDIAIRAVVFYKFGSHEANYTLQLRSTSNWMNPSTSHMECCSNLVSAAVLNIQTCHLIKEIIFRSCVK